MTARLLEASGVFIGENLPINAEDREFAKLLKEPAPDRAQFFALVEQRRSSHKKWGFKAPFRNHWELLEAVEDIRFVVVFRDVLAVANRNRISVAADIIGSMSANLAAQSAIVQFISRTAHPALLFSYEKALIDPREISKALIDFIGAESPEDKIEKLTAIIQPNEPGYVASEDPSAIKTRFQVDQLKSDRVQGWARRSNGGTVSIAVELDGQTVAIANATIPRPDLARKFGGDGRYAFDVTLPLPNPPSGQRALTIKDAFSGIVLYRASVN